MPEEQAADLALRIGDLLLRSGVVTVEALEDSVGLAHKMRMPLGRVLGMHGHLNEEGMQAALQLQDMIDARKITLDSGVKALEMVALQGMEFNTALRKLAPGVEKAQGRLTNKLGEVMRVAGIVNPRALEQGLMNSLNTGLPLGLVLVGMGAISNSMLHSSLLAQRLIRDNVLTREEIIQALRVARLRSITLKQSLQEQGLNESALKQTFGIGELFVLTGFMTEGQLLSAQELELVEDKPIEQVLLDCGYGTEITTTAAAQLLHMIREGTLFEDQAANILKRLRHATTTEEMAHVLSNLGDNEGADEHTVEMHELLRLAGLVSEDELKIATPMALQQRVTLVKTLFDAGILDQHMLEAAQDCKEALDSGIITIEQAVITLVYAMENQLAIEDTLIHFGWAPSVLVYE